MLNSVILQITTVAGSAADSSSMMSSAVQPAGIIQPSTPPEDSLQLFELLVKGGPIMIPIALLSVLTLYFFFERFFTVRKASKLDANFMNNINDFIKNNNVEAAKALCKGASTPITKMIGKGISKIGQPEKEIESAMENAGKLELYSIEKNLSILSIIGRVAPILGFIGTIMGVIVIFYDIGLSGDIAIKTISTGLYQKMITSASGLVVGLMAYISYFIINNMVDKLIYRMESASAEFIESLQQSSK